MSWQKVDAGRCGRGYSADDLQRMSVEALRTLTRWSGASVGEQFAAARELRRRGQAIEAPKATRAEAGR